MDISTVTSGVALTRASYDRVGLPVMTFPACWASQGDVLPSPRPRGGHEVPGAVARPVNDAFTAPRVSCSGAPPV